MDVVSSTPKRLNQFVFSQCSERVGAAVWCSYFYSAILMAGTFFFDGVIYQFWPGDILVFFPNLLWIFLKVLKVIAQGTPIAHRPYLTVVNVLPYLFISTQFWGRLGIASQQNWITAKGKWWGQTLSPLHLVLRLLSPIFSQTASWTDRNHIFFFWSNFVECWSWTDWIRVPSLILGNLLHLSLPRFSHLISG